MIRDHVPLRSRLIILSLEEVYIVGIVLLSQSSVLL